jgi:hypothetical protein
MASQKKKRSTIDGLAKLVAKRKIGLNKISKKEKPEEYRHFHKQLKRSQRKLQELKAKEAKAAPEPKKE